MAALRGNSDEVTHLNKVKTNKQKALLNKGILYHLSFFSSLYTLEIDVIDITSNK